MKISKELDKRFLNESIVLTSLEKEDKFLRQVDPNSLIVLAKYIKKLDQKNVVKLTDLKKYYKINTEYRIELFYFIQSIEEKLTGYIVQHIAIDHPDFHLQSKNFNLDPLNKIKKFLNINKFILDLRTKHHNIMKYSAKVPPIGYISLQDFISEISLGMKTKIIKYCKIDFSDKVLSGFNIKGTEKQKKFALDFFFQLNKLRNMVAHFDIVLNFSWKNEYGEFNLDAFVSVASYFVDYKEFKFLFPKAKLNLGKGKLLKKDIRKILKEI